jgi:hypothetical protein
MSRSLSDLTLWLEQDEANSRPFRAERLQFLLETFSRNEAEVMFQGGTVSHSIYLELRLAFIHGLFFGALILTIACIEQELAGALYARGDDQAARATLDNLLSCARECGEIDQSLFEAINKLKMLRNSTVHFRPPLHEKGHVARALRDGEPLNELPVNDAVVALEVLATFINRRR